MRFVVRLLSVLSLLVIFMTSSAMRPDASHWVGTLCDKTCYHHATLRDGATLLVGHERSCIMKCAKNGRGIGVVVGNKFFGFDRAGEQLAWKILLSTKLKTEIHVDISGTLRDSIIQVVRMKLAS